MLQLKIKAGRRHIPIFDLPAAIGREGAYREIGDQIDALISLMDTLEGDADLEDAADAEDDFAFSAPALRMAQGKPGCEISEPDATTYVEWHTRGSHKLASGAEMVTRNVYGSIGHEDDEDDDPAEDSDPDYCLAGDDRVMGGSVADPGLMRWADGAGDEADAEGDHAPLAPCMTPYPAANDQ